MVEDNNNLNECYDSECDMKKCFNPDHYNFICLDPSCQDKHCENHKHYNKQLLMEYQEHADFSSFFGESQGAPATGWRPLTSL